MKTYLFLLITLFSQSAVYSQAKSIHRKNFNFGVRTGLAHSNLYGSKIYTSYPSGNVYALDKASFLTSYTAGIWGSTIISTVFSVVGEVNVTEKGQRNSFGGINESIKYHMTIMPKLQYVCVPIVLQYNPKQLSRLGLYAGFEPSWLLNARQVITGTIDTGTTDIKPDFSNVDFGIVAGVNYVIVEGIMFDVRIVNGMKDISPEWENTFVSNKSFQLGVKFYLSK